MRRALFALLTGCVAPTADEPTPAGDIALVRIAEGDSLSAIADRLAFPGGWQALARENAIAGDLIRAGAGLRVPVAYLREAGVEPATLGLEPFEPPRPPRALVPCHRDDVTEVDGCIGNVCTDTLPAVDPDAEGWDELADGAVVQPRLPREVVRIGDRIVAEIPNGSFATGFEAHRVDLDGDRRDELVLVFPIEIRNHEGWEYSRVLVIGDAGVAQLDVAHWGVGSLIEADGQCELLATDWRELVHPLDGTGTYLVGRPLRYDRGTLVPRGDEVVRRMRTYFHVDTPPRPADWLADSPWWHELAARGGEDRRGEIASVERAADGVALDIIAAGERIHHVGQLGWAPTSMLLPAGYAPADASRWIGTQVLIADADGVQTVWLAP